MTSTTLLSTTLLFIRCATMSSIPSFRHGPLWQTLLLFAWLSTSLNALGQTRTGIRATTATAATSATATLPSSAMMWTNPLQMQQVLGGSGPLALDYASHTIPVDKVMDLFPHCAQACGLELPCAQARDDPNVDRYPDFTTISSLTSSPAISKTTPICRAASTYIDSSLNHRTRIEAGTNDALLLSKPATVHFCAPDYVCCHPELCRARVLNCSFNALAFLEPWEAGTLQLDEETLRFYARFTSIDMIENMWASLTSTRFIRDGCNHDCNAWTWGLGDISPLDCPRQTCACSEINQASVAPSGAFVCRREEIILPPSFLSSEASKIASTSTSTSKSAAMEATETETETASETDTQAGAATKKIVTRYVLGDASLGRLVGELTRSVCAIDETCMQTDRCMDFLDFQRRREEKGEQDDKKGTLSGTALAWIIAGSIVGTLVLVGVVLYCTLGVVKRKQSSTEPPHSAESAAFLDMDVSEEGEYQAL